MKELPHICILSRKSQDVSSDFFAYVADVRTGAEHVESESNPPSASRSGPRVLAPSSSEVPRNQEPLLTNNDTSPDDENSMQMEQPREDFQAGDASQCVQADEPSQVPSNSVEESAEGHQVSEGMHSSLQGHFPSSSVEKSTEANDTSQNAESSQQDHVPGSGVERILFAELPRFDIMAKEELRISTEMSGDVEVSPGII